MPSGWVGVGTCVSKENPKSDLDLDSGFVNNPKSDLDLDFVKKWRKCSASYSVRF